MVSTQSKPRVPGGPPILHNNAPLELYQACEGAGGNRKRDGSCPLTHIDLPTGTEGLPASSTAAGIAGGGGQPAESAAATAIISCSHAADPQNTCAAIANGPGWCVCDDSAATYAIQTSTDLACGWTTLPPITSFDCPITTTTLTSTKPQTTQANPTPSTQPVSPPNAGIAIWLQQYTSVDGVAVDTWVAYSYTPGDAKLGNPCKADPCGTTPVPDGTLLSAEMSIYPTEMAISAYDRKLKYTSGFDVWVGSLWDTETGVGLAICKAVVDAVGVPCGAQYVLTPRVTCEWVN